MLPGSRVRVAIIESEGRRNRWVEVGVWFQVRFWFGAKYGEIELERGEVVRRGGEDHARATSCRTKPSLFTIPFVIPFPPHIPSQ